MLGHVEQQWSGDTLSLSVTALGQTASGRAIVEEQVVRVEVELPWVLAMLTGKVRQTIEQHGQKLLGHKT
jgi:hypothetical protein